MTGDEGYGEASHEDICNQALKHYEKISMVACEWVNTIPKAIMFYKKYQDELSRMKEKVKEYEEDQLSCCYDHKQALLKRAEQAESDLNRLLGAVENVRTEKDWDAKELLIQVLYQVAEEIK